MVRSFLDIVRIPEAKYKLLLTLLLLAVYRLGFSVVLPIVDQHELERSIRDSRSDDSGLGQVVAMLSLLSASNIGAMTVFGLGIMPYISASILFQLLATVYPPLEALQKEGESGRKKINEYTRYATVIICFVQSFFWVGFICYPDSSAPRIVSEEFTGVLTQLYSAVTMTAGCVFLMWIAEQVDEFGIGSGVSLLIMAGILARLPEAVKSLFYPAFQSGMSIGTSTGIDRYSLLMFLFCGIVVCVIWVTQAQREIPVLSTRHARAGRTGAGRQTLPLRLNQSGVMPVIFASSLLTIPMVFFRQLVSYLPGESGIGQFFGTVLASVSDPTGVIHNVLYVALIYFFCFFWSAITFNPRDVSNNLRDSGCFILGFRPGARTAAYLEQIMTRLNFVGGAFLSFIAVVPTVIVNSLGVDYLVASFFGGTGLLICVSVAIEVVKKLDGYLLMHGKSTILPRAGS